MDIERTHHSARRVVGERVGSDVPQLTALTVGIIFISIGAIGLWRLGSTEAAAIDVGRLGLTRIAASAHVAIGVIALVSASRATLARVVMTVAGFGLVAFGVATSIKPMGSLGFHRANGFVYLLLGTLAMGSAILSPTDDASS